MAVRRGSALLRVRSTEPGAHRFATLRTDAPRRERVTARDQALVGAGIYGCFLDGRLFYVGIFAGTGRTDRGNVARERWCKHVGGMSLRGHRVSLCRSAIAAVAGGAITGPLANALHDADADALCRDRGLQATLNKARFAAAHWDVMACLDDEAMRRFQFCYVRPAPGTPLDRLPKSVLKHRLEVIERRVVDRLKPPCNRDTGANAGIPVYRIAPTIRAMRAIMIEQNQ